MKLVIILLLSISSVFAQTLSEFSQMTDAKKIKFLESKALFIDGQNQLENFKKKNPTLQSLLAKIGNNLSNIWGDTVLEGPYSQTETEETQLTGVYLFKGIVYAYSGTVSALGIFTESDGCEANEETDEWEGDCSEVFIYENFVMDFSGKFIESDNYVEVDT